MNLTQEQARREKFMVASASTRWELELLSLEQSRALAREYHAPVECWLGEIGPRVHVLTVHPDGSYTWRI